MVFTRHRTVVVDPRPAARTHRRWAALSLSALGALALGATPGFAAPIGDPSVWKVEPQQAPVAGVPVRIEIQGNAAGTAPADPEADADPAAGLAILPPGVACPGSYAEVTGAVFQQAWHWLRGATGSEPFAQAPAVQIDQPGSYTACGYFGLEGLRSLEDDQEATTIQYAPAALTVARPTVQIDAQFDGPLQGGQTIRLRGTASSNAPETVSFQLNRATVACGATARVNQPVDQFTPGPESFPLYGVPHPIAVAVGLPRVGGEYHLCTYAARDGQEGDPDLLTTGPVVAIAGAPSPPPVTPPLVPPANVTPPVAILPPPMAIDTSILTQPVVTVSPIVCEIGDVAVRRGRSVVVRCPRAVGTIGVRVRPPGARLPRTLRTFTLRLRGGRASLPTRRLQVGTWAGQVRHDGRVVGRVQFVVRAATAVRKATPQAKPAPRTTTTLWKQAD